MLASRTDYDQLAETIRAKAKGRGRIFVAIDGPGASGKSTFAQHLAASIPGSCVVHVDDFYLPSGLRSERVGRVGPLFDLPRLAREVTIPASKGHAVQYQRYDWDQDDLAEWIVVSESAALILEGVFCLAVELREAYTYKVWCRADPNLRLARGLARDGEGARSKWVDLWMPAEDEYESREKPEGAADLILDSSQESGGELAFHVVRQNS